MERLYFIVNPIAGTGRSAKNFALMKDLLKQRQVNFGAAFSEYPGHAVELTKAALADGERRIVAVGGDGTVNEVASALCGTGAVMGILPFGTGNDLSRTLGLPTDPAEALEVLLGGHVRAMDAGTANGRFFVNIAGYGFDVDVLYRTEKFKKRLNGMLPYLLGVVESLAHLRTLHMTVRANGQTMELEGIIIVAGNGRYLGGGMMAAPQADPFDGKFDVCIVKNMPKRRFIPVLSSFVKGTHLGLDEVLCFRADEVTVECPEGGQLDLDGELCGEVPVTFRLIPGAIPMLVRP